MCVDDLIIEASNEKVVKDVKEMHKRDSEIFKMKDLGRLKQFIYQLLNLTMGKGVTGSLCQQDIGEV